jgi:hypothetical protein
MGRSIFSGKSNPTLDARETSGVPSGSAAMLEALSTGTTGRPDMTANCAFETIEARSRIDVLC